MNKKLSMIEMQDSEDFWIGLVEESIELDWREAYVPVDRLPISVAMALAERLNLEVEVDASEYVFYQARESKLIMVGSRVLH
ncbi:MAG: hypothetical protein V4628_05525 [Pseudomonadota bacterium]